MTAVATMTADAVLWQRLGSRLRAGRREARLSQQDVATALGVPRSAVSQMEHGHRRVLALELSQLATLYRTSTRELLDEPTSTADLLGVDLGARDLESVLLLARFLRHQRQRLRAKSVQICDTELRCRNAVHSVG